MNTKQLTTPISFADLENLKAGDPVEISGTIYVGRDAVIPQVLQAVREGRLKEMGIDLEGGVIFHSAVSKAGLGPTSSNKVEIEGNMAELSDAGIRLHLGKGALSDKTVQILKEKRSIFVVIPPISAYLTKKTLKREVAAFEKEGMEAFWRLEVDRYPGIVAIAHGETIF
ncbi:MAG: fumarate hydratase C-terminal domain-containing protein [Sphaerochaetaceae bacterium]|nr:fumarate hydratase C-terminal domain-containing protein [Sphaerochaetaceae bacterium]